MYKARGVDFAVAAETQTFGPVQFNLIPKGSIFIPAELKDPSAIDEHTRSLLPSAEEGFNLLLVADESISGQSFYNGNGRTFISILRSGETLQDCLARLYQIQFETVFESIKLRGAPFRKLKLRFILLEDGVEAADWAIESAFTRYFGPIVGQLADVFDFDVQFRRQAIGKLPEGFKLQAEFFAGPKAISSFANNDEFGPEPILRMVLLQNDYNDALLIKDWGAVVSSNQTNDLQAPMQYFMAALRAHLRLSPMPMGAFSTASGLTPLENDLLKGKMAHVYMKEALSLLIAIQRAENELMTHEHINQHFKPMLESMRDFMKSESFSAAQNAFTHAYNLHYHPDRLGPPYFPDEHKFAVYLPVYLPLVLPLLVGVIKCLKELRTARNEAIKNKSKTE